MLTIDGAQGEGGGQIVRSSLALATLTNRPICIRNVRAGRSNPGLLRQHLTAVRAAAKVCQAEVDGADLGSSQLTFAPNQIRGGKFEFSIGSAGSTCLIAQTILPPLLMAESPSSVCIRGGTHNPWAPPFDFLQRSYLPQLQRLGTERSNVPLKIEAQLNAYGFYPAGGGELQLAIQPARQWRGFELLQRGGLLKRRVQAVVAGIPRSVAERECETIRRKSNWTSADYEVVEVDSQYSSANVVLIEQQFEQVTEVFMGIGKPGLKAERVAGNVLRRAQAYLAKPPPVGEYLAD